jgi:hypothetical protein
VILEGAFYKLPEILLGQASPRSQYEATLANHLAMAVLLELNARNIPMPQSRIHIERPYPLEKVGPANRVDLHVDLKGIFTSRLRLPYYGVKADNWIEAKFYGGIGRAAGAEAKTENAGRIARDLLRLCVFVQEERSSIRDNSRSFVAVFNRKPDVYLAFQRRSKSEPERQWLKALLSPGCHKIDISTDGEAATFVKAIGTGFIGLEDSLELSLNAVTYTFEPTAEPVEFLYWGYLVRIIDFTVCLGQDRLDYHDSSEAIWSEEQAATQQRLAERVLHLMGGRLSPFTLRRKDEEK